MPYQYELRLSYFPFLGAILMSLHEDQVLLESMKWQYCSFVNNTRVRKLLEPFLLYHSIGWEADPGLSTRSRWKSLIGHLGLRCSWVIAEAGFVRFLARYITEQDLGRAFKWINLGGYCNLGFLAPLVQVYNCIKVTRNGNSRIIPKQNSETWKWFASRKYKTRTRTSNRTRC